MCRWNWPSEREPRVAGRFCRGRNSRTSWPRFWRRQGLERFAQYGRTMISFAKSFLILCAAALTALAILSGMTISPAFADPSATLRDSEPTRTLRDSEASRILRDALAAACEESETSFGRFLTAANAEAFAHLAPERRVKLMQRLVLLDAPGRPEGVANPSGRPVLRCTALGATSEMRLGGASVRENLAFIPVEIHASDDPAGDRA